MAELILRHLLWSPDYSTIFDLNYHADLNYECRFYLEFLAIPDK